MIWLFYLPDCDFVDTVNPLITHSDPATATPRVLFHPSENAAWGDACCTQQHQWIIHANPNSSTLLTPSLSAPTKTQKHTNSSTHPPHKWWSLGIAHSRLIQTSRLWKADRIKSCTLHFTIPSAAMSVCILHIKSTLELCSTTLLFHVWFVFLSTCLALLHPPASFIRNLLFHTVALIGFEPCLHEVKCILARLAFSISSFKPPVSVLFSLCPRFELNVVNLDGSSPSTHNHAQTHTYTLSDFSQTLLP